MNFLHRSIATTVFIFCAAAVIAQTPPPPLPVIINDSAKKENIIITKKNPVKEKVTVVIDGNNITVNGKPVEDFKSDDIDITENDLSALDNLTLSLSNNPSSYSYSTPGNDQIMMNDKLRNLHNQMNMDVHTNGAFLGVMSEKTGKGAKITDVTKASAADKAGLKVGDVITKINDVSINTPDDLYKTIGKYKQNEKVTITYLRDEKPATTQAVLGKSDQMHIYSWNTPDDIFNKDFGNNFNHNFSFSLDNDKPRLGITAQDTENGNGVKITGIDDEDGAAAKAGLKENDIITQVNGKAINSTDDLRESVKDIKKGDTVKISYKRNNQTQSAEIKFPKDLKTIDL